MSNHLNVNSHSHVHNNLNIESPQMTRLIHMTCQTKLFFKLQTKSYESLLTLPTWTTSFMWCHYISRVRIPPSRWITTNVHHKNLKMDFSFMKILCLDYNFIFHILNCTKSNHLITTKLRKQTNHHYLQIT